MRSSAEKTLGVFLFAVFAFYIGTQVGSSNCKSSCHVTGKPLALQQRRSRSIHETIPSAATTKAIPISQRILRESAETVTAGPSPTYSSPVLALAKAGVTFVVSPLMKELKCQHSNMGQWAYPDVTQGRSDFVVIDVGAHGADDFTIPALRRGMVVYAFEPLPSAVEKAKANFNAAGLENKVSYVTVTPGQPPVLPKVDTSDGHVFLIQAGASSAIGKATIFDQGEMSQILNSPNKHVNGKAIDIALVRVDDVYKGDVYMFKIDAQGFEGLVLEGAKTIFEEYTVQTVHTEFSPKLMTHANPPSKPEDMLILLHNYGLACFDISNNGHYPNNRPSRYDEYVDAVLNGPPTAKCQGDCHDYGLWDELLCFNYLQTLY